CLLDNILDQVLVRNVPPDPNETVNELVEQFLWSTQIVIYLIRLMEI
nr:hypothetical protein [Tanacetum cinerariifolium]